MVEIGKDVTEEKLVFKMQFGLKLDKPSYSYKYKDYTVIVGKFDRWDKGGVIITKRF